MALIPGQRAVPHLKVGVAQIESARGALADNLARHVRVIDHARSAELDLLLFPELSLTGAGSGALAPDLALTIGDPLVRRLAEASGPMCTVFGLIEEAPAGLYYDTALAVRDGRIVGHHRKLLPATFGWREEGKHYGRGTTLTTFPAQPWATPWQAGILICNDLWQPPLAHVMACRGATVLVVPASAGADGIRGPFDDADAWATLLRHTALVYGMPVLLANRVGTEGDTRFWGGSCIYGPDGHVRRAADDEGEALLTLDLDFDEIRRARFDLPVVRETDPALLARLYGHLADGL